MTFPAALDRWARNIAFHAVFYPASAGYSLAAFLAGNRAPQAMRRIVRAWSRMHRWCVVHLLGCPIRSEGAPLAEPVLYAVRHESFFEAIDTPALFRDPAVFAKEELFSIPLWGPAARTFGLVPVARDQGAAMLRTMIREAKARLADGRPLVIFPEGTRVPHGTRRPLQAGFAGLYKMLGVPVVPVAVNSGPAYHRAFKGRGPITYRFGAPIPPGLPRAEIEARVLEAINALNEPGSTGTPIATVAP